MEHLFWFSAAGLFYMYIGYPLGIICVAAFVKRPVRKGPFDGGCSVVTVVYNEAAVLAAKLKSVLAADGQSRIREIIVASDGSTDGSVEVVEQFLDPRIRL